MYGDFEMAKQAAKTRLLNRDGIGRLQEKQLHATLKYWLDADESHHEIPLPCGAVADIFDGEHITEIQTANFSAFRIKLMRLLEEYPVTVIYPLVRKKTLVWIDPQSGEPAPPRTSPKTGGFWDAAPELLYIRELLFQPNLTLRLQLVDVEEYKLQDGWGNNGKRGAHRLERVPVALGESLTIRTPADLKCCLPPWLTSPFTAAHFQKAMRYRGRKLSAALKLFLATDILTREKQGRGYVYTIR